MSEYESKLKEENVNIKELFNFNGYEVQFKHIKELFPNYIRKSKNDPDYFVNFLEFYSHCRPNQYSLSKELVECVYSFFPEQINEIQQLIKNTDVLKFIIFPEDFSINENKEQKEMFYLLQNDDINVFI